MRFLVFSSAVIIAAVASYCNWQSQPSHYEYPLDLDIDLAANFGEVRKDHFHMGLDMRTLGRENIAVKAADDGHVSRITVSEDGYGNAIYIDHPNGMTTLYGHLNKFAPELQQYLLNKQNRNKKWEQDIKVPTGLFQVKKNELIGLSGNTGHSEGPHLHFEILDTKTGKRLNPLLKGMSVSDKISPVIKSIYWYDRSISIYRGDGILLNKTLPDDNDVIRIPTPLVSLGIEATDKNANTKFTFGIYKAELYMDGELMHSFSFDEIGETDTRYVNGAVDYEKMILTGQRIQYLFTLPGSHLPAYNKSRKGKLNIGDGKPHHIQIMVFDAAGNKNSVGFTLKFDRGIARPVGRYTRNVAPNKTEIVRTASAEIIFGNNSFYDTVPLIVAEENSRSAMSASPVIKISSNKPVPVHDSYKVSIESALSANSVLRKRTVMMLNTSAGQLVKSGNWKKNRLTGYFDRLGSIQLVVDTVPPSVSFKKNLSGLRVKCSDNLGTIASFSAELDGRWVPFAKKGNEFTYMPGSTFKKGKHKLKVMVADVAGNTATEVFNW